MKLFVYGTLKRGHTNHSLLNEARYLCDASTDNNYTLFVGGLPCLVEAAGKGAVGELYEIDEGTLYKLDRLEGHPRFYERKTITVYETDSGHEVKAYAYIYPSEPPYAYVTRKY
jgi:gamma-glutamylcyclotransferase (GGCT)/AIG2-like uncharacterized protein YtfP